MKTKVSFSGGKDSTAMLIRLLELNTPIDYIVFADTGFEFPEMHGYIKKVEKYIKRKITILKPNEELFKKWFYGIITRGKNKGNVRGYPLIVHPCWWARESKIKPLQKYQKDSDIVYIGIAYDELKRVSKEKNNFKYPLIEWKWTEQDCINYLNKKGLFNPLYTKFNRLGCWICQKQKKASLYSLYKHYPLLWAQLKWWDEESKRISNHYIKDTYSLDQLENDFKQGKIPKNKLKYVHTTKETQQKLTKY